MRFHTSKPPLSSLTTQVGRSQCVRDFDPSAGCRCHHIDCGRLPLSWQFSLLFAAIFWPVATANLTSIPTIVFPITDSINPDRWQPQSHRYCQFLATGIIDLVYPFTVFTSTYPVMFTCQFVSLLVHAHTNDPFAKQTHLSQLSQLRPPCSVDSTTYFAHFLPFLVLKDSLRQFRCIFIRVTITYTPCFCAKYQLCLLCFKNDYLHPWTLIPLVSN